MPVKGAKGPRDVKLDALADAAVACRLTAFAPIDVPAHHHTLFIEPKGLQESAALKLSVFFSRQASGQQDSAWERGGIEVRRHGLSQTRNAPLRCDDRSEQGHISRAFDRHGDQRSVVHTV